MVSVLIVDDSTVFCRGLTCLLEDDPNIRVVGVAGDIATGLDQVKRLQPDVVLVDLRLRPRSDAQESTEAGGLAFLQQLRESYPQVRAIVLTGHAHPGWVRQVWRAGAMALLDKDCAEAEISRIVHLVAQGYAVWNQHQRALLEQRFPLTSRELEVLGLVAVGLRDKEIAQRLGVSVKTVGRHLENIRAKLETGNRYEAVQQAQKLGMLPPVSHFGDNIGISPWDLGENPHDS